MKAFRGTIAFALVVAALIAFIYWDQHRSDVKAEGEARESALVKIKAEDVTKIRIGTRTSSLVLEKQGNQWQLTSPVQDLADPALVAAYLQALEAEKTLDVVDSGDAIDWKIFGLDDPTTWLELTGAGATSKVSIGAVKAYDANLYARVDQEKQVRLVTQSWDVHLSKQPKDFRDKHFFRSRASAPEIKKIETDADGHLLRLVKTEGHWKIDGQTYPVIDEAVNAYVEQLKSIEAAELTDEPKAKPDAKYGLAKPVFRARLYSEGAEPVMSFALGVPQGKPAPKRDAMIPAISSEGTTISMVSEGVADSVLKWPQDFYDRKLPFKFAEAEVGRIRIETPEVKGEYFKKAAKDADSWAPSDPGLQKSVESSKLKDLVTKLGRMEAIRILEAFKPGAQGKPVPPKLKSESKIILSKESGEPVFEFAWGELVTEKGERGAPDATYLRARTSKVDHVIGVPELSVRNLLAEKTQTSAQ